VLQLTLWRDSAGGTGGVWPEFRLTLPEPQLNIADMGANAIRSWPTKFTDYTLEFTTNAAAPAFWDIRLTTPAFVGGENVVTDAISIRRSFIGSSARKLSASRG
jgi:hypothetical protein